MNKHLCIAGIAIAALIAIVSTGCGGGGSSATATTPRQSTSTSGPPSSTTISTTSEEPVAPAGLTVVALGDSWPAGAHCGGCRTFMGRYADALRKVTGAPVTFVDLTQAVVPGTGQGQTPESLLADLQRTPTTRQQVQAADVVVIHTGLNDLDHGSLDQYQAGTCGGTDGADCFRHVGEDWQRSFDSILSEIGNLRQGHPIAIRLVTAENIFISDPELLSTFGVEFGRTAGKLIIDGLATAMCDAAARHAAACIDVRPVLNGRTLDQPADENAPESHQAIADALVASGLPELTNETDRPQATVPAG